MPAGTSKWSSAHPKEPRVYVCRRYRAHCPPPRLTCADFVCRYCFSEMAPVCAVVGGILAQEIVKVKKVARACTMAEVVGGVCRLTWELPFSHPTQLCLVSCLSFCPVLEPVSKGPTESSVSLLLTALPSPCKRRTLRPRNRLPELPPVTMVSEPLL